ncbi:MAG: FAD-dependent oxidoreductase [Pseudomonadota bacterium]
MTEQKSIAVVGAGVAGLSAAWLLSKSHAVTLFESNGYAGGHTNTIDIDVPEGRIPVDTGFIVYNPPNYPNLVALFDHLGVESQSTDMSFAASLGGGAYEYSGTGFNGIFAQRRNLINVRHWKMLKDIVRFFKQSQADIEQLDDTITLGDYLTQNGFGKTFARRHLLPMAAAIWSMPAGEAMNYPARAFIRFFANHGLLQVSNRPPWRTVTNGARSYVEALKRDGEFDVLCNAPVASVTRRDMKVAVTCADGVTRLFDDVVMATHADTTLRLLQDSDGSEQRLLQHFGYSTNRAVVHSDPTLMPTRKRAWSAWNYIENGNDDGDVTVTYWMNVLQSLPTRQDIFVTLNPAREPDPNSQIAEFEYEHPIFDTAALAAQRELWSLQGRKRTWFCGAYFGAGFHEDALQAGLAVAEELGGGERPWQVDSPSSRICLSPLAAPAPLAPNRTYVEAAE